MKASPDFPDFVESRWRPDLRWNPTQVVGLNPIQNPETESLKEARNR